MSTGAGALTPAAPGPATPVRDFETTAEVGYYQLIWRRLRARRITLVAAAVITTLALACIIVPFVYGTAQVDGAHPYLLPLQFGHPLGTDEVGRDLLQRNLDGGRVSLAVGALAMVLTIAIATVLGATAGFFGGPLDSVLTAFTNAILSIPALLILAVLGKWHGGGVATIVIGISLVSWPTTSRIVRAVVLSLREKEYVEAARALGTRPVRIISRHILPNVLGPIVVSASLTIGQAIILESALSFLGIGIGAPLASWGSLLNLGYDAITGLGNTAGFLYALWPGLLILTTVLCFNYLGDALRDAFDPRALER